jgi:hypothetical protein
VWDVCAVHNVEVKAISNSCDGTQIYPEYSPASADNFLALARPEVSRSDSVLTNAHIFASYACIVPFFELGFPTILWIYGLLVPSAASGTGRAKVNMYW